MRLHVWDLNPEPAGWSRTFGGRLVQDFSKWFNSKLEKKQRRNVQVYQCAEIETQGTYQKPVLRLHFGCSGLCAGTEVFHRIPALWDSPGLSQVFGVELPPHSQALHVHAQTLCHAAEQLHKVKERDGFPHSNHVACEFSPEAEPCASPLSSCRPDSAAWLGTERRAGRCAGRSQACLRMRAPLSEGTDASAAPAD